MAKAGRKPIEIEEKELISLAAQGLTDQEIIDYLNISTTTFYKYKRQKAQFTQALAHGRARGVAAIANKLYNKAAAGDLEAMKFFLERRAGWIRQENLKHEGEIGGKHEHKHSLDDEIGPVLREILSGFGFPAGPEAPSNADPGDSKA
jgi:hypothetical protein